MELNHLQVFFEVAKAGQFIEASRKLHISQSALSRSVALLEESQGVKLFERSKKGVSLTPVGQEVYRLCEALFHTVNQIKEVCKGSKSVCEGPLRFATPDHVVNDLLVSPLRLFRQDFPKVVPGIIVGNPDEIISRLSDKECEFALLFVKVSSPKIDYQALREERMALVVHPELWREHKSQTQTATLDKILGRQGYISSLDASQLLRSNRVLREVFGKVPRIGVEVSSQEAQKRLCLNRGGIAYLSHFMVEKEIKNGDLFEIPIKEPHVFNLWLAQRKGHQLSLPAQMFLDRLRTQWG